MSRADHPIVPESDRVFFVVGVVFLALLTYLPMPPDWRTGLGLLALAVFILSLLRNPRPARRGSALPKTGSPVPMTSILLLYGIALFLRFNRLDELAPWPLLDEGAFGYTGMRLSRGWDGQFIYGVTQLPPLPHWLFGIWFRMVPVRLETLWLLPALLSTATFLLAYRAARPYFPPSTAWLAAILWGVLFWPVYSGRFAYQSGVFHFFFLGGLISLGAFLKAPPHRLATTACVLGIVTGLGFYTYLPWPVVAALLTIPAALHWAHRAGRTRAVALAFLIPTTLLPIPLLIQALSDGYGGYMGRLLGHESWQGWRYLEAILWGVRVDTFSFKPFFGGFLDPVSGALLLTGIRILWSHRDDPVARWLLAAFPVSLLPALLPGGFETCRMHAVLPVMTGIIAIGLASLSASFPPSRRPGIALLLSLVIAVFSAWHLFGAYGGFWREHPERWTSLTRSRTSWKAFQILRQRAAVEGPGYVMLNFEAHPYDRTLDVATAPFNLFLQDPTRDPAKVWAAGLTDIHYLPHLQARFPDAEFHPLADEGFPRPERLLVIWPRAAVLGPEWFALDRGLAHAVELTMEWPLGRPRTPIRRYLEGLQAVAGNEPFLISILSEIEATHAGADRDLKALQGSYEHAIRSGYPAAHLLNELGTLAARRGDRKAAAEYYRRAIASALDHTPARENLRILEAGAGRKP